MLPYTHYTTQRKLCQHSLNTVSNRRERQLTSRAARCSRGLEQMWFLLLIALDTGKYRAEIVVRTLEQCEQLKTSEQDLCVPVTVQFAAQPEDNLNS